MIESKDIFYNYENIKDKINVLLEEKEEMTNIMKGFVNYLVENKPEYTYIAQNSHISDTEIGNVSEFLTDIPSSSALTFVDEVSKYEKESDEFRYIAIMHAKMISCNDKYKNLIFNVLPGEVSANKS